MKKKLLTVALAATMVLSSAFSALAAETKIDQTTLAADTCTEQANPLQGKNAEKVTITYTINWDATAPKNGWDGVFSFYDADTTGRVSFSTAPYLCYNAGTGGTDKYIDAKADAWCTANCEAGKDYTFQYVITADAITVTCDGTAVAEFKEVGRGAGAAATGYQDVLDAFNTYPTFSVGCGLAKTCYWNTEPCTISITIDDGIVVADNNAGSTDNNAGSTDNNAGSTDNNAGSTDNNAGSTNNNAGSTTTTPATGDATTVGLLLAVAAVSVVVVLKRRTVAE